MNDKNGRPIISPMDRTEHEQELGYLAAGLPASAKTPDAANWAIDQIDRLRGALSELSDFVDRVHGKAIIGRPVRNAARAALANASGLRTGGPLRDDSTQDRVVGRRMQS